MLNFQGTVNRVKSGVAGAAQRVVNAWSAPGGERRRWPPPEDEQRLADYQTYRNLHRGEHETVYVTDGGYSYDDERPYVTVNMAGEITDLMVDRLFGNMPKITAGKGQRAKGKGDNGGQGAKGKGQGGTANGNGNGEGAEHEVDPVADWIDGLITRSNLHSLLIRLATGTSYRGDGALKVRGDKRRGTTITAISPSYLFLTTDPDDTDTITEATIGYLRWREKQAYLFQEIHTPGLIEWALYELRSAGASGTYSYHPEDDRVELNTLDELAGWPDAQATGIDEILIVPIALGGDDEGGIYGRSDYADIIGLQGELNNRVTQEAEILDKHADPFMYGPPSLLNEKGVIDNRNRYVNVNPGEPEPGYLVWDGQLLAVNQQIVRLIQHIVLTAGLSPESFQMDQQGGAESGRALRMRQHRTADAVEMRQIVYGEALARAMSIASKLDRGAPALEPQEINIEWADGLPTDPVEEIEGTSIEVQSQLLSRRTAIQSLHPQWSEERVEEELEEIQGERGASATRIGLGAGIEPVTAETTVASGE